MIVRKCDCCKREINSDEFFYTLKVSEINVDKDQQSTYPIEDLCEECNKDLSAYYAKMKYKKEIVNERSKSI